LHSPSFALFALSGVNYLSTVEILRAIRPNACTESYFDSYTYFYPDGFSTYSYA
jgi:hypothetical protein